MFVGIIYDPASSEDSIEGRIVLSSDLEEIKNAVSVQVKEDNQRTDFKKSYEWSDEGGKLTYYPINMNQYGYFAWAQVKNLEEGQMYRFSEYGDFD